MVCNDRMDAKYNFYEAHSKNMSDIFTLKRLTANMFCNTDFKTMKKYNEG